MKRIIKLFFHNMGQLTMLFLAISIFLTARTAVYALPPGSSLVFDRGLPTANLNLDADADPGNDSARSNIVIWAGETTVIGDDFTIGNSGESWIIDRVRVWTDDYETWEGNPISFADEFNNLRLYGSLADNPLNLLMSGNFTAGDGLDNPNIILSKITYINGQDHYYSDGFWKEMYQLDFDNLNWSIDGGVKYQVGIYGEGKLFNPYVWVWTHHASNKDLSGSLQQGTDDNIRVWADPTAPIELVNLQTVGVWNKPADINMQIWAHRDSQQAGNNCYIKNTGPRSINICKIVNKKKTIVRNNQNSIIINNVNASANTGNNRVIGNNGVGVISTGDAQTTVGINNRINQSIIEINQ